jgi:ABC-2 type transport system permease protein
MVWIALALLVLTSSVIGFNTARGRWTMSEWRSGRGQPTFQQWLDSATVATAVDARLATAGSGGVADAVTGCWAAVLQSSGFVVFSRWVVYAVLVGFLLPIWSLSFATEALGGERESRTLVWLFSRPLSRPAIYLAKFVALLPWTLGLNLGGFAVMSLAGGAAGRLAWTMYWPAVAGASFAFCALFHLMSAVFRRPAVIAIVYSFFLETILGTMPGYMKRISIGFYTRCLMFESAQGIGMQPPEKPSIYMPVDSVTAWTVLAGTTLTLLIVGMIVFARSEYWDDL